jgi:hypothetical protein
VKAARQDLSSAITVQRADIPMSHTAEIFWPGKSCIKFFWLDAELAVSGTLKLTPPPTSCQARKRLVVAPHDRAQRGVGLHRRAVDPDPLALQKTMLSHELQHEAEHLLVRLVRQTRTVRDSHE